MPNIITLTTDFGLSDHFVGTMKGVILGIAPRTQLIDISHAIPPFEIGQGAFAIAQAYPYFPKGTVHVVVVDPGVGTSRRPILAEAAGQYFIAPDNGVLSMVYVRENHRVRAITAQKYFLPEISQTFHGRDVFAPSAAHLATGVPPARFGKPIHDYAHLALAKPQQVARRNWSGTILHIDQFGNLITNLHIEEFPEVRTRLFELSVGLEKVRKFAQNFADGSPGELLVIVGSSGYLEVAVNQGSAAKTLGCGIGSPVEIAFFK
ncbi:MAG TPA: SAM-dependent chlorinase/fluorinase [Bryobacteraceae bacterium]|nr:SAM-dependent chlorinase/fluorinase [Bryobacteraceae bacterium]